MDTMVNETPYATFLFVFEGMLLLPGTPNLISFCHYQLSWWSLLSNCNENKTITNAYQFNLI